VTLLGSNTNLIVAIEKASQAREACNAKDFRVSQECRGSSAALKCLTTLQSSLVELTGGAGWRHLDLIL
jgi:hypothetical protein